MGRILKKHKWAVIYLVVIFAIAGFVIYHSFYRPNNPPLFEIINYAGKVEVKIAGQGAWRAAKRGEQIGVLDRIRTGSLSDVDFKIPGQVLFRLREQSVVDGSKIDFFKKDTGSGPYLEKGNLLVYVLKDSKGGNLKLSSPLLEVSAVPGSLFLFSMDTAAGDKRSWTAVLRGKLEARSKLLLKFETYTLSSLQKTEVHQGAPLLIPVRMTREEWDQVKDGYELMERVQVLGPAQMDLAKQAGNLFEYVFDHGTFYTPKIGYATREFVKDENTGEVDLLMDYDVFPTGSFVGMYMKIRDLDLSKFEALTFDAKRNGSEGFPESMRIELKTRDGLARAYAQKDFEPNWKKETVLLNFNQPALITEITFVFINEKVGEYKKGELLMKNFNLIPRKTPLPEALPAAAPVQKSVAAKTVPTGAAQPAQPEMSVRIPPVPAAATPVSKTTSSR